MTDTSKPDLPVASYTDGYEQLRCHALEPGITGCRHGWILVARGGIVSWLDAFAKGPAPTSPPRKASPPKPSSPTKISKVGRIDILAAMVKANMEEVPLP